jgi:hypothetical protein
MDPLHLVGRAQAPLVEEEWKQLDEGVVKWKKPPEYANKNLNT